MMWLTIGYVDLRAKPSHKAPRNCLLLVGYWGVLLGVECSPSGPMVLIRSVPARGTDIEKSYAEPTPCLRGTRYLKPEL